MKRHCFTLLELIVVIMILFIAAGMGVAVLRDQSPARKLETAALEWEEFCARVRYQALESGEEREIVFKPAERLFKMRIPETENSGETEDPERPTPRIEWKLPDDFELDGDSIAEAEDADEDGLLPMCRFYSDGGAAGRRRLELRIGELKSKFEISALTGRVIPVPPGSEPDEAKP